MELDELKNIWQQASNESISSQIIQKEELSFMIKGKSSDILTKLKRNLLLESILCLLCFPAFVYVIFVAEVENYHRYVCSVLFFITLGILVAFWFEYRSLQKFDANTDLITSLKSTVTQLTKFTNIYMIFNYLLLFPMLLYGSVVGIEITGQELTSTFLIVNSIVISPLGYWWLKYYIRKVYQQHLDKLKNCLSELEENIY